MTVQQEWMLEGEMKGIEKGEAIGEARGKATGKINLILQFLRSGVLNAAQARESLNTVGAESEFARQLVDETLKQLPA